MRLICRFLASSLLVAALSAGGASAQDTAPVTSTETTPASGRLSYEEYRLGELEYLTKRSRNGMISSSAVTAVGIALVTPAWVKECVRVASSSSFDDVRCSSTGKVLLGVGFPILIAGATGLIVTAILFGVRKGKMRSIQERLTYERHRAVHWDPERSAFAF